MNAQGLNTQTTLGSALLDRVGNTPLVRLERLTEHLSGVQILGKAEWANPGGSVKDRAASAIVAEAQRKGQLIPGKILLDATSGNTGIAYAMLGAAQGFPVTLCMPSNVSPERKHILKAYGAQIIWTSPAEGSDGAIRMARKLAAEKPDRYFYANQYGNENNWKAHYYGTANEIWQQTEGRITHFVAGLGTSGTFMGTTRRLRELNPKIQCISMQPDSPFNGLEGLKHMATAIVPPIYDEHLADADRACLHHVQAAGPHAGSADRHLCRRRSGSGFRYRGRGSQRWSQGDHRDDSLRLRQQVPQRTLLERADGRGSRCRCGRQRAIRDGGNEVVELMRAGNTRTDSAHNRYHIAPQDLIKAQREGRAKGLDIVGFYHSHPDHPAQWSSTDFAEAHWYGCSYVITAVAQGKAAITNSFLLTGTTEENKRFEAEVVTVADGLR